jgi:hypothetical protein
MAGHQDRPPFVSECPQEMADPKNSLRVKSVNRFVKNQYLRIPEESRGNPEPLAHTEGKLANSAMSDVGQPDGVENLVDAVS